MQESQSSGLNPTPGWTLPKQEGEVKRLTVFVEARFLFVSFPAEKVELGSFLSKFREVGDVVFVPQKTRTLNDDEV
jgi:hypothetical protein